MGSFEWEDREGSQESWKPTDRDRKKRTGEVKVWCGDEEKREEGWFQRGRKETLGTTQSVPLPSVFQPSL